MNVTYTKFKTLEETENIRIELEGRHQTEFEMKESITSFECELVDVVKTKDI